MILLPIWLLVDNGPYSDRTAENDLASQSATVNSAAGRRSSPDSISDLSELLDDPALSKDLGADPIDDSLQLEMLDNLLAHSLTSPLSKEEAQSKRDARSSGLSQRAGDSSENENTASAHSSHMSYSLLNSAKMRIGKESNSQVGTLPSAALQQSGLGPDAGLQTGNHSSLWPANSANTLPTPSEASSVANPYDQSANSAASGASSPVSPSASYFGNVLEPSPSANSKGDTVPPAFRTPANSPGGFSSGSTFATQNSSQIIQTFPTQPALDGRSLTPGTPSSDPTQTGMAQPSVFSLPDRSSKQPTDSGEPTDSGVTQPFPNSAQP